MISAQTLCVCREGKPVSTFPDHALTVATGFRCLSGSTPFHHAHSSGSTFTIEAPSLLPTQKLTGVVLLSTNTRRMLVERGNR
jgi:hypothetical protein